MYIPQLLSFWMCVELCGSLAGVSSVKMLSGDVFSTRLCTSHAVLTEARRWHQTLRALGIEFQSAGKVSELNSWVVSPAIQFTVLRQDRLLYLELTVSGKLNCKRDPRIYLSLPHSQGVIDVLCQTQKDRKFW